MPGIFRTGGRSRLWLLRRGELNHSIVRRLRISRPIPAIVILFLKKQYNVGLGLMKSIDLMYQTMLAELGQRSLDAAWTADFPPGSCVDAPGLARRFFRRLSANEEFYRSCVRPLDVA